MKHLKLYEQHSQDENSLRESFCDFHSKTNESNIRKYRGFDIVKDTTKIPGEYGYWFVPELYYRKYANKVEKGFITVSITQGREAIDEWYEFSIEQNRFKTQD
jgi:hypothetical protein